MSGLTIAISADYGSTGSLSSSVLTLGSGNTITFLGGATTAAATPVRSPSLLLLNPLLTASADQSN